jgi:hypothetical protein
VALPLVPGSKPLAELELAVERRVSLALEVSPFVRLPGKDE